VKGDDKQIDLPIEGALVLGGDGAANCLVLRCVEILQHAVAKVTSKDGAVPRKRPCDEEGAQQFEPNYANGDWNQNLSTHSLFAD
jgi:hypothetical protein